MTTSRGEDIRNYIPALSKGAKIPLVCLSAGFTTGITEAGITSAYIGSGAVTKEKIAASAVRNEKISAGAVTSAKIRAAFLSGTLVSGKITKAIAHGLGVKPKFVVVNALPTLAQGISATRIDVYLAAASAATTTNFYIIGTQPTNAALKYVAYVQL
jgi:hypothetical protein